MPGVVAQLPQGKRHHHGIEVVDDVVWKGWEPGREYTRNIIIKNIKVKMQKLKFKGPSTRFFSTLYPQPIVLSAGTSYTLPVTFRPLEKVNYEDKVQFETQDGSFSIPIRAVLPQMDIEVPKNIDFNMCAAADFRQLTFEIKNISELETPFQIECTDPFRIEPREGALEPFSTVTITATFSPKAAVVYEAEMIVKFGTNNSKITKLEGIGKYPHLLVRAGNTQPEGRGTTETVINFGKVNVGQTADKWIELCNMSPVNVPFTVEHPIEGPSMLDVVFQCLQKEGVVPAMSAMRLPISFTPSTVGMKCVDYFHVKAIGNISKTVITCIGSSKGPQVYLSQKVINFKQINTGMVATKPVDIMNESDAEAVFQFQIDCSESVFKFEQLSGVLPPNSKRTIILQFRPIHPINYHRRVTCLVHNQGALFLDLLGTCHAETIKPAVLQTKHLKRYSVHMHRGLTFTPPEQLNAEIENGTLTVDKDGHLCRTQTASQDQEAPPTTPMDEYFNDGYHSEFTACKPHISMDTNLLDFGQCTDLKNTELQTVTITNHTEGKVTVVWMGDLGHRFSVSPVMLDLPAQGSSSFTVSFRPNMPNQFYGSELECYVYYKSQRDYRLVEERTHCPPWCLTLLATGYTFMADNETFLPRYLLDTPNLIFPAVNTHESTYRTLLLSNTGPTPILFDFDKDVDGIFGMKPARGLVAPNSQQLCVVKCLPPAVQTYKTILKLHLNAALKNDQDVTLLGSAEAANVQLDNEAEMYFKPTCIGTRSVRKYAVKNISRIPLHFEWKLNNADAKLLTVTPPTGLIQPNQKQYHTWSFMPGTEEKFVMKPALICWGQGQNSGTSGGKKKQFTVRAVGEGTVGEIKSEESYVHFGNIVVGSQSMKTLVLYNDSSCSLEYTLSVQQELDGPYPEELLLDDKIGLHLEKTHGILPARAKEVIMCTARPSRRVSYTWTVNYQLCTQQENTTVPSLTESKFLCHMLTSGVFPTMSVTDARCYGSAVGLSKRQLWDLFSLDNLNADLDADPSAAEVKYNMATRQSYCRKAPVMTRAVLDFNFSAAPVNSDPCIVQLMVENTGCVKTDWSFLFPSDLQLELEYWSETGEFDDDELHQMKVLDNCLFSIEPKSGCLEPGQCQTVRFSYNHIMPGTDRLPVLLKLARGREVLNLKPKEIWLNFVGVTVDPERRYLHFPSSKFIFTPVAIGETPPKQIYELYNGGSLTVKYEIDTTPLELLKQENFDHGIFEVENFMGEILPGRTHAVEWRFSPLEAKTYMVDVPIHIHGGETAIVTFTGIGYDKRALGDTMQLSDNHEMTGVPSMQSAPVPGQMCFLSQERVSFGNIPLFTQPHRIIVITNKSYEHGAIYKWHVTMESDSKIVSIQPKEGILPPGGSQVCNVTFISFGLPSFYDVDLICETTNETDYNQYQSEIQSWNAERSRQRVEFTIDREKSVISLTDFKEYEKSLKKWSQDEEKRTVEFTITEANVGTADQSRPPSGRLRSLPQTRTPSPDETDFTKYRTLPPIRHCTLDNERNLHKAQKRFDENHWKKPEAPKPFLLHLGVTARTHDVADFQQNFPEDYPNFCIDRTLCNMEVEEEDITPQRTTCLSAEADIIAATISDVLRGLLDDKQFQDSCHKVINAPIPYFRQFTDQIPRPLTPLDEPILTAPPTRGTDVADVNIRFQTPTSSVSAEGSVKSTRRADSVAGSAVQVKDPTPTSEPLRSKAPSQASDPGLSKVPSQASDSRKDQVASHVSNPLGASALSHQKTMSQRSVSDLSVDNISEGRPDSGRSSAASDLDDRIHTEKQTLKKLPEFNNLVESLLENTITNIIQEAFSGEFNITARPRLVALPPRTASTFITPRK